MISWIDEFVGIDWERYSQVSGSLCCVVSFGFGAFCLLFSHDASLVFFSLFGSLVISIWEYPVIFACVPRFENFRTALMENYYLQYQETKAIILLFFGICLFHGLGILLSLFLIMSAISYGFAAVNRRYDAEDNLLPQLRTSYQGVLEEERTQASTSELLGGASGFGTF